MTTCLCTNRVHYRLNKSYCKNYYKKNKYEYNKYQSAKRKVYNSWKKDYKAIVTDNIFTEYINKLKRKKK